ncbi:flagellar hook-associated protein FlgK [Novosphingobium aerophilum]|uniref:Flagellar hook-associated protein 1 n=1 Tax=Novosphingobium aerophilum TaxID=2839843 RepID=A0A7X1F858_9SPHN|nr:flagellar hook-associated protein FlgK [Novosphingobium aerophilum]MBC2652157.1 flagellar hook-associated protein FlgK [Novosphingobium aerophilum]
MASDLLAIGRSGAQAARVALDVTAQNIANASSEGYVRRSARMAEVSSTGGFGRVGDVSLSGVRLDAVVRNADLFRQAEVRRTGADAARAGAEVAGLENTEAAIEQSRVYDAVVKFEGSLQQLVGNPTSESLRASVIEEARTMAGSFNIASKALDSAGAGLRFEATDGIGQVNTLAAQLSQVNLRLARASDASSDQTALLDQRDRLLQQLSNFTDVTTTVAVDNTVSVQIGGSTGPLLVQGGTAQTLAMTTATDGTITFNLGGTPVALVGGSLAGKGQALTKLAAIRTNLDTIAKSVIDTVNAAQTAGVTLNGTAGQAMFSGTTAATMSLVLTNGTGIATAPAGAAANSRDATNLNALRSALAANDPAKALDALLFDISGTVAGRKVTRDALQTIANTASVSLQSQAGVDLDQEAVNLVRYQQAFQASGKVMQTAKDIFDTLLAIR